MRIHLTFQIEHRHLLFRKLRTQRIRILQGQIECERHKRDSHSTDQPRMVQSLQEADCELKDQCHADGEFLLIVHPFPVRKQQPRAKYEIHRHTDIAYICIKSRRIISIRCLDVSNRKRHRPDFRNYQKYPCRQIKRPLLPGLFLHQYRDVLIEKEQHQRHRTDKQPMQNIVQHNRYTIKMVDRIDRSRIKHQMHDHHDQKCRKCLM